MVFEKKVFFHMPTSVQKYSYNTQCVSRVTAVYHNTVVYMITRAAEQEIRFI